MKKFFETIKNIFRIEELKKRLVYTFLLILVYRLGCFVVLPGIDATSLAKLQSTSQEGLVGLLNMSEAHNGDIVVAMIDGDATVKRFYRERGHFRLQPENSTMRPIITKKVTILGKVTASYRLL